DAYQRPGHPGTGVAKATIDNCGTTATDTPTPTNTPVPPTNTPTSTSTAIPPNLTASGVCSPQGVATFTVTNTGGDMTVVAAYVVTDSKGQTLPSGSIQLKAGASQTITAPMNGNYGTVTLTVSGTGVSVKATTDCTEPTATPTNTPTSNPPKLGA